MRPPKYRCAFVGNLNISVLICNKTRKKISRRQHEGGMWARNPDPNPRAVILQHTSRTTYEVTYCTWMCRMVCIRKRCAITMCEALSFTNSLKRLWSFEEFWKISRSGCLSVWNSEGPFHTTVWQQWPHFSYLIVVSLHVAEVGTAWSLLGSNKKDR